MLALSGGMAARSYMGKGCEVGRWDVMGRSILLERWCPIDLSGER